MKATLLYDPKRASKLLGGRIAASGLRAGARSGRYPHVRIAGRIAFTDEHLAEIIAAHTVTTGRTAKPRRKPATDAATVTTVDKPAELRARPPKRRLRSA